MRRTRRALAGAALGVALLACSSPGDPASDERVDVPAEAGPLPEGAVTWSVADTVHVGDRTVQIGGRVRAMVVANGRLLFLQGHSDVVRVADGDSVRRTDLRADELHVSEDGRFLGLLDTSQMPWSTLVVDLETAEVVVRDDAGMGDEDDDLTDLYEDAEPRVLGFDGDDLFVEPASAPGPISWDVRTGERTQHEEESLKPFFFAARDPGGGRVLPALVRRGRLVVPRDPYRSTQWGHVSPDGSVALMPVGRSTQVFAVGSGRRLPADLRGRQFILGGWTGEGMAYGVSFDRRPYGPARVRLVSCLLTVEERRCRVLRSIRAAPHRLVLFPTGSAARDY